jgi:FkbM family methyltransferase
MSQESSLEPDSVPRVSYAPDHEDILLDRVFGEHVGTFMAVGASAPTVGSLTYFFYRRGWRGVNLEPIPRLHARLEAVRPGDLNLPLAAWDANGELPYFEVATAGAAGLSTFSASLADAYRTQGVAVRERQAPARTIESLVEELTIDQPDFLSIDADGTEEAVLRGIPLDRWRPRVIVVGSNRPEPTLPGHQGWEPILRAHGYQFAAANGINRFYLRDDLDHDQLRRRLELPIGARDLEPPSGHWRIDAAHHREGAEQLPTPSGPGRAGPGASPKVSPPRRLLDRLGVISIGYRWAVSLGRVSPSSTAGGPTTGDAGRSGSP